MLIAEKFLPKDITMSGHTIDGGALLPLRLRLSAFWNNLLGQESGFSIQSPCTVRNFSDCLCQLLKVEKKAALH